MVMKPRMSRVFAMPNGDTFSIRPIRAFLKHWLAGARVVVDPFARNAKLGTVTNDLSPETTADHHMDAEDFCTMLAREGLRADAALFDPPYSPRQISELYQRVGLPVGMEATQNGRLYRRVRDSLDRLVRPGGIVLSFGWNSAGMGVKRGYEIDEILLVAHGGAHNDTICVAERKIAQDRQGELI